MESPLRNWRGLVAVLGIVLAFYMIWVQIPRAPALRGPGHSMIAPLSPAILATDSPNSIKCSFSEKKT